MDEVVGGSDGSGVTVLGGATEWEGRYVNLILFGLRLGGDVGGGMGAWTREERRLDKGVRVVVVGGVGLREGVVGGGAVGEVVFQSDGGCSCGDISVGGSPWDGGR